MQIHITLSSNRDIVLPMHYNHMMQAFIYQNISPDLADFLHTKGYEADGRIFKLFTFSRFKAKFYLDKDTKTVTYTPPITCTISSPVDEFCKSFAEHLLQSDTLFLGDNEVWVEQIQIDKPTIQEKSIVVIANSPVIAYSTLLKPEGGKYTCYFMPREPNYNEMITQNLKKKYKALTGEDFGEGLVTVEPLGQPKLCVVYYKKTVIKGCIGKFRIRGDEKLLKVGIEAGFGSKNSQGFGCVKLLERR